MKHFPHAAAPAALALSLAAALLIRPAAAVAAPSAEQEAARLPAHLADATGADPAKRALATEWLMNTLPETLPLIEQAADAAKAKSDPSAPRLAAVVTVLKPIDRARDARLATVEADGQWNLRTALHAYDLKGIHDRTWDAMARQGIEEFVSRDPDRAARAFDTLQYVTAHLSCNDPLVLYFDAVKIEARAAEGEFDAERLVSAMNIYNYACDKFDKSDYPADRRVMAMGRVSAMFAKYNVNARSPDAAKRSKRYAAQMVDLWPKVLAEKDLPFSVAYATGCLTLDANVSAGGDRGATLKKLLPALRAAFPKHPGVAVFEGNALIDWAWDARGTGWGNTVTLQGALLLHTRLAEAQKVLEAAYAADPTDVGAPTLLMTVGLGQGWGAQKMDFWFTRARRAYPDRIEPIYWKMSDPYTARMQAMLPRWGGSHEAMLAFGRQCLAGRNWRGDGPDVLLTAHLLIAAESPAGYWSRPEVWADLDDLTAGELRVWPDDPQALGMRALQAIRCGRWKAADAALAAGGKRLDPATFGGPAVLALLRATVAFKAATNAPPD